MIYNYAPIHNHSLFESEIFLLVKDFYFEDNLFSYYKGLALLLSTTSDNLRGFEKADKHKINLDGWWNLCNKIIRVILKARGNS